MAQWSGQAVSIRCTNDDVYQGLLNEVKHDRVTLQNVFKNGKPSDEPTVSLSASGITDLQFVEPTVGRAFRPCVAESSDDDHDLSRGGNKHVSKKKPAQVVRAKTMTHADMEPESSPRQRRRSNSLTGTDCTTVPIVQTDASRRLYRKYSRTNTDCFDVTVESCLGEFDFEKNLALFDKQRVYCEIENSGKTNPTPKKTDEKYKHNEMVIKPNKAVRQIKLIDEAQSTGSYTTDSGYIIPTISYQMRRVLFEKASGYGFTEQRLVDTIGRNICDMVFQLIGGSTRLNPQNTHQRPTIVLLCGRHTQGCFGVSCARNLANHNVDSIVFTPAVGWQNAVLNQELTFYKMSGGKQISTKEDLPTTTVDLIINCLDCHEQQSVQKEPWYKYIANWCNTSRAHVLAIDPVTTGCSIETKWSVHIGLPLKLPLSAGQTYLCDVGLPRDLFKHIGIKYRSPFGMKFCIPLYCN